MKRTLAIVVAVLALAPALAAQPSGTIVEGSIRGPVTWGPEGSPYIVRGDVYIYGTLHVLPGTVIVFEPGSSLTIRGDAIIEGSPSAPVRVEAPSGGVVTASRTTLTGSNIVINGTLQVSAGSSSLELSNVTGGSLTLYRIVDSNLTIAGARLEWLLFGPGYTRDLLEAGDPAVEGSIVRIEDAIVYYAVAGKPRAGDPAYVPVPQKMPPEGVYYWRAANSTVELVNVTVGYGFAGAVDDSTLELEGAETRELLLAFVYDSRVYVNDSIIAYGRGIYIGSLKTLFSKSIVLIYGSDVFNATQDWGNGTPTSTPVVIGYSDSSSQVAVEDSWLSPPRVAGVEASLDLADGPVHRILPARIVLDPPIPLAGQPHKATLDVEGGGRPMLMVAVLEYEYGSSIVVVPGGLTATLTAPQVQGDDVGLERLTLVAFYPGMVAGAREAIIVLREVQVEVHLVSPDNNSMIADREVDLTVSVDAPERIRDYVRVLVYLDGEQYEAERAANGVYTATLPVGEGVHEWYAQAVYGETVLAETWKWRFTVDYTPPVITYAETETGIEITVSDNVTGVSMVTVTDGAGKTLYRKAFSPPEREVTVRLAAGKEPVTVEAYDAAGNRAATTILLESGGGGGGATTTSQPQQGGAETTTRGPRAGVPTYPESGNRTLYIAVALALAAAAAIAARRRRRRRRKYEEELLFDQF